MLLLLLACGDPVAQVQYLAVVNINPSHGAANIRADTTVSATFNDDLVADSWAGTVHLIPAEGEGTIDSTLSYDEAARTLTLAPHQPLDTGASYLFALTSGVTGQSLGPLPAPIEARFTVEGPVTGANQAPTAVIAETACGALDEPVVLDGSASSDPDGDTLGFAWRVANGPADALLEDEDQAQALFTPAVEGLYVLGLQVDDGERLSDEAFLELSCPGAEDTGLEDTATP